MSAPTVTARGKPVGNKLKEGYSVEIAFSTTTFNGVPGNQVSLWEKDVKPYGLDTGEPVDNTTQHLLRWRVVRPRALVTATPISAKCAYDPQVYPQLIAMLGYEQSITVHFPDYSTGSFYGFLKSFVPDSLEQGKQPEANVEIVPTNWDPVNNVEQGPIWTPASGTTGEDHGD